MTNEMVVNYLTDKINNSWYGLAANDYGVKGKVEQIEYNEKTVSIKFIDDGVKYEWSFTHYSDYTPAQLYSIWMEAEWREVA